MRNKVTTALTFFIALSFCACQNPSVSSEIKKLQKRTEADMNELQNIEKEYYTKVNDDYRFCDSMLQFVPKEKIEECFNTLNLAQAYLIQFHEVKPIMKKKFDYSQQQLESLLNDISTNYINDSLAKVYLFDEQKVADTLHEQILYFKDRLSSQEKELNKLKETLQN